MEMLAALLIGCAGVTAPPASQPFDEHFARVSELLYLPETYLLFFSLDVNGDGQPEMFVAQSGSCGNGGCGWHVYTPSQSPGRVKYLGAVGLHAEGFRFQDGVLTTSWHMSASEWAWGQYRFHGDTIDQLPGRSCGGKDGADPAWCESELDAIRKWRPRAPKVMFGKLPPEATQQRRSLVWTTRSGEPVPTSEAPTLEGLTVETATGEKR